MIEQKRKWFTCCACGLSCEEDEVEEVIDWQGRFDFLCHRCFHDYIGYDRHDDDTEWDDEEEGES